MDTLPKLVFTTSLLGTMVACTPNEKKTVAASGLVDQATEAVVRAVIQQDSLALSSNSKRSKPIASLLQPIHLITSTDAGTPPPPVQAFAVSLRQLLSHKYYRQHFFSRQDSLFLLQQAYRQQEGLLDTALLAPGDFLSVSHQGPAVKRADPVGFYRFSRPLFSQDSLRACIYLNYTCFSCGSKYALFLEKSKGKWKVVERELRSIQ